MKSRVNVAQISLHISTALYLVFAAGVVALLGHDPIMEDAFGQAIVWITAGIGVACAVGVEVTVWGLKKRKFWAWVTALCIFGLYVPSLLLPLGVAGLWGLLTPASRAEFGMDKSSLTNARPELQPEN